MKSKLRGFKWVMSEEAESKDWDNSWISVLQKQIQDVKVL